MSKQRLIKQLKQLEAVKPSQAWREQNRELLLNSIAKDQVKNKESDQTLSKPRIINWGSLASLAILILPTRQTMKMLKPSGVLFTLSFLLLTSGIFSVSASQDTIPGDKLYSLKIATEKVQKVLTFDEADKAKLEISFAGKRIEELEKIIENPTLEIIKDEQVSIVMDKFEENIKSAQDTLTTLSVASNSEETVLLAEVIDEKVGEYQKALDEVADEASTEISTDVKGIIEDAAISAGDNAKEALIIIIEKHESGETDILSQGLSEKLDSKIEKLSDDLVSISDEIENLLLATSTEEIITPDDAEEGSATSTVSLLIAQDQAEVANKVLEEAKSLIEEESLVDALDKIHETRALVEVVMDRIEDITEILDETDTEETVIDETDTEETVIDETDTEETVIDETDT